MKKLNKFIAILVALAMMAALAVTSAFATTEIPDSEKSAKAASTGKIAKYFVVAEGVKVPTVNNTFSFTYQTDSDVKIPKGKSAPEITPVTITTKAGANTASASTTDGNSVVASEDIPTPDNFPVPGVYAYKVVETTSEPAEGETLNGTIEKGGEEYIVRYYVKNGTNGTEISNITVEDVTPDSDDNGNKKQTGITDPTDPDQGKDNGDGTKTNDGGFSFKNTYKVTNGTDPGEGPYTPDDLEKFALRVTKTVSHAKTDGDDTEFPFTVTLNNAATEEATTVNGYIYTPTTTEDGTTYTAGTPITFTYGTPKTEIKLKDGQVLGFPTLPAGTRYSVEETMNNAAAYSAYTPSYTVTSEGKDTTGAADTGASLKAESTYTDKTFLLAENNKDKAAYTNDYNSKIDTPEGILISNLPYIALALVAVGGLVAYVVVRRRNEDNA